MKADDRRNIVGRRSVPFICVLIAAATSATSLLKGKAPEGADSDAVATKVESLIFPFEQDYKRVAEDAWAKYKVALLRAKEAAFNDANLDLLNKIQSELLSPTAAPREWPSNLLRSECDAYHKALDSARNKYLQQVGRLIVSQLRNRELEIANALNGIRSSLSSDGDEKDSLINISRQTAVDDFESDALSMVPFAASVESSGVSAARVDAPYSSSKAKSKGLLIDWSSPHGEWIGAHYSFKRPPLFDARDLIVRFRLWLNGGPAPSSAEVHFSDKDGEVFTYRVAIAAPHQRGWRWVIVPVKWEKHRMAFGGYPGNGVIGFPVSLHCYAFIFDGEETPASSLVIDDVSVTQTKSGGLKP
jgi:hypothetical protein